MLDLTHATIVTPPGMAGPEAHAVALLREEVERRTGVRWPEVHAWPAGGGKPLVALSVAARLGEIAVACGDLGRTAAALPTEGYATATEMRRPAVTVAGRDGRGLLYGVGRLLRELRMERGSAVLPEPLRVTSAPRSAIRGHQLGYRPKTNSYDGWSLEIWEQYIRDLVVFGANAIELVPPRTDDEPDSPHFPLPPMEMMTGMSALADGYGLDVWIWFPAMDRGYDDPAVTVASLAEWHNVFERLPRVDAVFVPGGDPGGTAPAELFRLLERQTGNLRRSHPRASMWVSPQGFDQERLDEFLALLRQQPDWLGGIVYGPQVRMPLPELRDAVPDRYPIRHYPDITHTRHCQYPVPDWDVAFAVTLGREPVNPQPRAMASIFRVLQPYTAGFITYSEGCNDDVNKVVWNALGWDPDADVEQVLREYARYFIGPAYEEELAAGLLELERNWQGPVARNEWIERTADRFAALADRADAATATNWRFQQALYRAEYDALVRERLIHESAMEGEAMVKLGSAAETGSMAALDSAEELLRRSAEPLAALGERRARVVALGDALFQSIRMQLSVERHQAIAVDRGANLDSIDAPLNSRVWLLEQTAAIRRLPTEDERRLAAERLARRADPGPGGFYDDLGDPDKQPHLVRGPGFDEDPAFFRGPLTLFARDPAACVARGPISSWRHAAALYDQPLVMRYFGLDPSARYGLRVVYAAGPLRLEAVAAAGAIEIHGYLDRPFVPMEFGLPPEATAGATLELRWVGVLGRGGAGRGCEVAEVWVMRL